LADPVTRRKFLARATILAGAAIAAGWAVPAVAYVFGGPASGTQRRFEWRALGSIAKVEPGIPTLFKTRVERTIGWVAEEEELSIYVFTEDEREYEGLSNVCTHLGCRVRWVGDQEAFFCPCHNATFSKTGQVLTGPPPAPLDRYEVKVEDGQVFVNLEV
jgi:Rieske Fe-S protein